MKTKKCCATREDGAKTLITQRGDFAEYNYTPKRIETIGVEKCDADYYALTSPAKLVGLTGITDTDNLFRSIFRLYHIASKDPVKPVMNCVHMILKGEKPYVETCDGFRLCRIYVDPAYGGNDLEMNVPADACSYGSWKQRGYDTLALMNDGKEFAFFKNGDSPASLSGFLNRDDYLKTDSLIASLLDGVAGRKIRLDRKATKAALSNIAQVKKQLGLPYRGNGVDITLNGEQITFSFPFDDGDVWEEQLTNIGEDVFNWEQTVSVNPKYLLDAISTIDPKCEHVEIGFQEMALSPLFVGNLTDESQPINLVLPLRKRP